MADEIYSFRSALHGFHRGDVVSYLSTISAAHARELEELREALRLAKEENSRLCQEAPNNADEKKETSVPQAAAVQESQQASLQAQELEAYRRAERYEREAHVRADRLYADACAAVEKTRQKLSEHQVQLGEINGTLSGDLAALQSMLEQIRTRLSETQTQIQEMERSLSAAKNI